MPAEKKDEASLQDLLRDLLASSTPEPTTTPTDEETGAAKEEGGGEQPTGEGEAAAQPVVSEEKLAGEGEGAPLPAAFEVEIIPPPVAPSSAGLGDTPGGAVASQAPAQPEAKAEPALLEGKLEIRVMPPVPPGPLSLLERALRERGDLVWLGTWGKPREGTSLYLHLSVPVAAADLFQGIDVVERGEVTKAGKAWLLKVYLTSEGKRVPGAEATSPVAPPEPAARQPSAPVEPGPTSTLPEAPAAGGPVDLQVSPVASLEALNRLERLLSSLGGRTTNVLSLDGVSTVLVTLEGIDKGALARKLQEKVGGIVVEMSQDRLIVRFPENW